MGENFTEGFRDDFGDNTTPPGPSGSDGFAGLFQGMFGEVSVNPVEGLGGVALEGIGVLEVEVELVPGPTIELPPAPPSTAIAGQLGSCGLEQYTVDLMMRGGVVRAAPLVDLTSITWERRLDAISTATVVVAKRADTDCVGLRRIEPYATELRISRNGFIVWEGPVYASKERRASVTIEARDVTHWLERRRIRQDIDDSAEPGRDGVLIASDVITAGFKMDDPNVLAYLHVVPGGPLLTRKTEAINQPFAFSDLSEIARTAVDWTVVGRRIIIVPTDKALGAIGRISGEDVDGDYEIEKSGRGYASLQITKGQGNLSAARGGISTTFGLVETVNQESSLTTQAALDAAADTLYPTTPRPPVTVRLADGVKLKASTPVTMQKLVPGVRFTGQFLDLCEQVNQTFRLQKVTVGVTAAGEEVGVGAVAVGYAVVPPGEKYMEAVVIGDSMTRVNAAIVDRGPGRWVDILGASELVGEVVDGSVQAATTATWRLNPRVASRRSDLTIVFLGANDQRPGSGVSAYSFGENIAWMLDNYPAGRQVVVYPWRWNGVPAGAVAPTESVYQSFRAAALDAANRKGAAFVDLGALVPSSVGYVVDWIHPNVVGHRLIAAAVAAYL